METILNAYLSYQNEEYLIDSLVGENNIASNEIHTQKFGRTKGSLTNHLIEQFINSNEYCQRSVKLLTPKSRKYSTIIFRLYFEHFMAKNWSQFSAINYMEFCKRTNEIIKENISLFPYKHKKVVNKIVKKNLLSTLASVNGLNNYILEMRKYNSYNSLITESIGDLVNNYGTFNRLFLEVLPELEKEIAMLHSKREMVLAS